MNLYLTAHTDLKDVLIDFIEVELTTGKIISLTWDESDIERTSEGFSSRYKGVYFNEEYANGKIEQLHGMKIANIGIYTESDTSFEITITEMEFVDGRNSYEAECVPYVTDSEKCDFT